MRQVVRGTRRDLVRYLRDRGLPAEGRGSLGSAGEVAATRLAVVLFPDGFPVDDVLALVSFLRGERADLLLVTGDLARLPGLAPPPGAKPACMLLPKPTFSWAILDAIKAHESHGDLNDP